MVSVRSVIATVAVATAAISTAASAADMPMPPPQIQYQPVPVVEIPTGSWYLRGDIGIGVQTFASFDHTQTNSVFVWPPSWRIVQKDLQDTTIFGLGVGYQVNNWFRFDVTGEHRTKSLFKATGSYTDFCAGGGICFDTNEGNLSSSVFMANAYFDLGTWWCLTPYIGAGVGGAYNQITGIQDVGINSNGTNGFGYSLTDSATWNLAWNVQAGVTYNVTNNFKIDLNWRFLNLGSPQSAIVQCQNTPFCPSAFYTLRDVTSQDFRIGVRWVFQPDVAVGVLPGVQGVFAPQPQYMPPPPPQYMPAPQPQYAPPMAPPVYAPQPPLSSRG